MTFFELQELVFNAGIVGAGGAGFPTHKKLSNKVQTIIVNAAECEPLLQVDYFLMKKYYKKIIQTLDVLVNILGADKGYIAYKKNKLERSVFEKVLGETSGNIEIKEIPDIYPAGDEIILTYEVTGKIIPEGNIPLSVGVVVLNVETLFNISNAMEGKAVTHKYVTVTGEIDHPVTVCVPVGTPVKQLLQELGIQHFEGFDVISGGPLMGNICDIENEFISKLTKGIVILPSNHSLIQKKKIKASNAYKRASSACCQCSACTDMCPRYLIGYSIEVHKTVRTVVNDITGTVQPYLNTLSCSGCGVCDYYACTQDIHPRAICLEVKKQVQMAGLNRAPGNAPEQVRNERKWRMIPSKRIIERCALSKYDRKGIFKEEPFESRLVVISLKQHVGQPAVPVVKPGDKVCKGQLIGKADIKQISANIHASIDGTVLEVSTDSITIASMRMEAVEQ